MSADGAPIVHGGGIAAAAARFGGLPEHWLDLSTGINPNPASLPEIPVNAWHRLPDRHLFDAARRAARDYYRTGDLLPLPVPGTQAAIQLLPRLLRAHGRVAVVSPTYGEYARVLANAGMTIDRIGSLADVRPDHGLVVVVNPNNPTGQDHEPRLLAALARDLGARGGLLLVDEAFGDCRPELSLAPELASLPSAIIFRSFGKFFGLAGVRLGFVIADPALVARFEEGLGPWAVSGPALVMAERLLTSDILTIRTGIAARHQAMEATLRPSGLTIAGRNDLFFLIEDPDAAALHRHLCEAHILTRIFDYAPAWMRIGLAPDAAADARLAAALARWRQA